MAWTAISRTWKSPLIFIEKNAKINASYYTSKILCPLIKSASSHFQKRKRTFHQDGAPSRTAKITQKFSEENLPYFITKNEWPPCSPNLNPMDFTVWGYLKKMACKKPHKNIKDLKKSFKKRMGKNPPESSLCQHRRCYCYSGYQVFLINSFYLALLVMIMFI